MPIAKQKPNVRSKTSLAALLSQLWDEPKRMTATEAKRILKYELSNQMEQRSRKLLAKNSAGALTVEEEEELTNYITFCDLLAILQSRARQRLKIKVDFHAPV
ncbi:hypothetical protein BH11PLA2_BH11PLA2_50070 [soil metagenome]